MIGGSVGGWVVTGLFALWANREAILRVAAEAVALAEKANADGKLSNEELEEIAVAAMRTIKPLRVVPEIFIRLAIRQICARRKKAAGKLAGGIEPPE